MAVYVQCGKHVETTLSRHQENEKKTIMWRSIKNSKPEIGIRVKVRHWVTGAGAPEADGWESVGMLRADETWSIMQNEAKTVDYRPVTHWNYIKQSK